MNSNAAQGGSAYLLNGCVMGHLNVQMAQMRRKSCVVGGIPMVNTNVFMFSVQG